MQSLAEIKVKRMMTLHFREHTEIHKTLAIVSWCGGVDFILKRVYDTGAGSGKKLPGNAKAKLTGGLMMYYYILGFGIACVVLFGIDSMETVCVKPAEMLVKALLWPATLMEAVVNYSSTHHNFKAAL